MASGSFGNGSGQNCRLGINWSSSKGNSGSTVNATLIAQNQNNWYFSAYVYGGYGITINGNQKTGSGAQLSGSINGSVGLISHSVWVSYTGDKTITISGYANFNGIINLSNQTISGNVQLDNVGTAPSMGSITSPTGNYVASETTTSLSVSWNAGNSYNNSGIYRVDVSINGGSWEWVSGDLGWDRRSYTYSLPNRSQGTTYQFRVCCGNNIGWSGHVYSAIVTLNYLNPPSIGSMPNPFNPYSSTSFTVGLSGGSQANGGSFMRKADIYMYNTAGNQVKWYCSKPSYGNTSITVGVSQTDVINALGTGRYSAKIYAIAWIENSNGSRSGYVIKESTVNINTDGGATPTLGAPTISGGAFGYPATCFASGISTVKVASASAGLRRAPSGTSISYKIACTGVNTQNSSSASFSHLSTGLKTITVTATDSRGLSTSVEKQIRIQPYNVPTIRNYSAIRLDNPQTSAKLTYTLAYSEIYAYDKGVDAKGTQLNNINSQQYSTNNSTWNNSSNGITVTGLSTESVYTIYLRIADKLQTGTYTTESYIVSTIKTNVAIRKHGVGLNCVPQAEYALDVSGNGHITKDLSVDGIIKLAGKSLLDKLFPIGAVYITYNNNNPGNFLGGTWERFGQGRTLVGEGTGNDGSTSMSFTSKSVGGEYNHLLTENEMPVHRHYEYIFVKGYPDWPVVDLDTYGAMIDFKSSNYVTPNRSVHATTTNAFAHTEFAGGSTEHNNIQPYIVAYFWRRIK